ncbi:PQQ-dependent sugar dehydrogenase [Verrucomicrobiales bacterium]|jgi:quinoprotein glucose dehydrogenase|nr:PQQ-dependent sugar dehydrogenase [Verrucomicrobiales bacterium]MDC0048422.1 PQQ-dependent sugar dehydrogenase [Verrucomicrobiota bacterium]NCG26804.1 glucose sorbosone dehydrogenase [Verrucomicrobiales bacterium]
MQKFYHSVKIFALSLILAISASGAPEIKFKVAYPNLKIKKPVWATLLPGTEQELIVSQSGTIHELPKDRAAGNAKIWFDLTSRVQIDKDFEEGLLGLVFHPDHKSNGKFYVYYSRQNPKRSVLSEFVTKDGKPEPASERILLEINQPFWNHDSGQPAFGPDGYLYLSTGDGGKGNDPLLTSQNLFSLLGKILRIDVNNRSGDLQYGIPEDNPFVDQPGARPEIWTYGMRNPWGLHFDKSGRLWCADVGQALWEEINIITKGGNYGWSYREGAHPFPLNRNPKIITEKGKKPVKLIDPVHEYSHADGISITGGVVYEGKAFPELKGHYIYGDWGSGYVWGLTVNKAGKKSSNVVLKKRNPPKASFKPTAFVNRPDGELWVLSWDGKIYEITK